MKKKIIWILAVVLAAVVIFIGSAVYSGIKESVVKAQFIKSFNKITEMDSKERTGKLELNENFDSKEYGKFVPLLNTEKNYYLELDKLENTFEEDSDKLLATEMNFNTPEDIKAAKEMAKSIDGFMNSYSDSIKKLNEKNAKEIEALNIPDKHKQLYISSKKEINSKLDEYIVKLDVIMKGLSTDLTEMINIVEKLPTRKSQAEINSDIQKVEALAKKMEDYDKQTQDLDNDFNKVLEETNKKITEKINNI
jgi:hypothetical protein